MTRSKITNISKVKLEFFIKVEGSEDVLVSINPGEVVFSDGEDLTKSMRVFERKNLISILKGDFDSVRIELEGKTISAVWDSETTKIIDEIHQTNFHKDVQQVLENELSKTIVASVTDSENPYKDLLSFGLSFNDETSTLDEAKKQAEEYADVSSDEVVKEKKKYNYKKKPGRKKKRGPKPGSKKKKGE